MLELIAKNRMLMYRPERWKGDHVAVIGVGVNCQLNTAAGGTRYNLLQEAEHVFAKKTIFAKPYLCDQAGK